MISWIIFASAFWFDTYEQHDPTIACFVVSMAGAAILKIAYGIKIQAENDPFLYTAERATEAISATTNAGSYLVDALPFCKSVLKT